MCAGPGSSFRAGTAPPAVRPGHRPPASPTTAQAPENCWARAQRDGAADPPVGPARPARRCRRPARGAARRSVRRRRRPTGDEHHGPQRAGERQRCRDNPRENVEQCLLVTRRGSAEPADVVVGVIAGVVDPHRSATPGGRPHQSLPQAGNRRRPIGDHPQHRVRVQVGSLSSSRSAPSCSGTGPVSMAASPGRPGSRGRSWRRPIPGSGHHPTILRRSWTHTPRTCRLHRVCIAARSPEAKVTGVAGRTGWPVSDRGASALARNRRPRSRVRARWRCHAGRMMTSWPPAPYGVITGDDLERGRSGYGRCR